MIETVQITGYRAFGLNLGSELELPELPRMNNDTDKADVAIQFEDLAKEWEGYVLPSNRVSVVNDHMVMFQVPETAIFKIEDGKRITVSPMLDVEENSLRLFILGTCMGVILMQRNILPLHGSAIAIDGKAYAIVGDSGAGKSTLATAFLNRGYQLLTDDVIAVSLNENGIPLVTPSYPQQKLWLESLNHFGMQQNDYQHLIERENKFAVPVQSQFMDKPLPLAGIFELVKGDYDRVNIQPIESLERIFKLFYHTYRNLFLQRAGLLDWHFQTTTKMANKIDFYQLQRPTNEFTAFELADLILQTIKKEENVYV